MARACRRVRLYVHLCPFLRSFRPFMTSFRPFLAPRTSEPRSKAEYVGVAYRFSAQMAICTGAVKAASTSRDQIQVALRAGSDRPRSSRKQRKTGPETARKRPQISLLPRSPTNRSIDLLVAMYVKRRFIDYFRQKVFLAVSALFEQR